ncbi:MAG: HD domain-containing protein [Cyanobacteria bacterium P01_D01_bin.6]
MMADLQRALEIAIEAHKGQRQKNGLPYVLHPLTLMLSMTSVEARISAVLHDVVEDTQWTLEDLESEGFPPAVIEALDCLTHRDREDYDAYIERIRNNRIASEVKLADLKDNMNIRRIPELKEKDLERLKKYHKAWRKLSGDE